VSVTFLNRAVRNAERGRAFSDMSGRSVVIVCVAWMSRATSNVVGEA
jgi:hypothetical protein